VIGALATIVLLAACGSSSTPQGTLEPFLTDWSRGDWPAMRTLVADPPADFAAANAAAFSVLGASSARFTAGRVRQSGVRASALVTERFALPHVGTWSPTTTVRLVQRNGRWLVSWTPGTINPALGAGDRLAAFEIWPARAPILGAGGVSLTIQRQAVVVGIVGSRVKSTRAVTGDLLGAGATQAQVRLALAQAKAHPDYFDAVFQVSKARFEQLKAQPGPDNVYAVPGTEFQLTEARSAITPQLAAHAVGTVAPITAQQLQQLGPPYSAAGVASGIRLVIDQFRTDVTKTLNYPDCPVMPTLVGSAGVLAAGWGCRWWAGRDKPKLVEASNPRRRWPQDPDDLEDAQKRPLRDAMLELEGEPDRAALITRRCELRRAAGSRLYRPRRRGYCFDWTSRRAAGRRSARAFG
jgi:hypothetical protein